jgi:ATP-dependent Clp protease ATP-binding subunit ClpB
LDYLIRGSEYLAQHVGFNLVGRNHDLDRLSAILMRSAANSVVLVGPGGVGITALCLGLQMRKADPDAPFDIVAKRLFWLDTDGLFSSGDSNKTSEDFRKIMARLEKTPDSILIIEDTRDFIEACRNNGAVHFINDLMSSVKRNLTQVIFETRDEDAETVMRVHSDLKECFTMMDVIEPVKEALHEIVTKTAEGLSKYHEIVINDDAILEAITLTNKYRTRDPGLSRAQPERSVTLLDRALASYRLKAHAGLDETVSAKLREFNKNKRDGEIEIANLEENIEQKLKEIKDKGDSFNIGIEPPAVMELRKTIKEFQKVVDANKAEFDKLKLQINADLRLTKEMVTEEFSTISGIAASKLNENEREKLKGLENALGQRIFGQAQAVGKLANAVKVARAVRRNKESPQASFMFLGPSGVGKTEIAKALASILLGSEKSLARFDMSEYSEKHAVAKLIGAPPGYELAEAGGVLTNLMRTNPNQILLFDEIEKADPQIFNLFLQILSDGRLTDNLGRTVSFADSIIIMTTNIGQPHFLNEELTWEEAETLAYEDLNNTYRPEFLNRFAGRENIVCFRKLEVEHIEHIVMREINKISGVYGEEGIVITIQGQTITNFCADHYDPVIGARGLPGYIETNLEPIFADFAIDGFTGNLSVKYDTETKSFKVEKEQ